MRETYFFHPSWPIIHEDNHLLALYKPAGLLVQGDETQEISLLELGKAWLKERYKKPGQVFLGLVHRLDRPVAGVLLFCRTSKAAARISEQFRSGTVKKRYLAVLEGTMKEPSGRLVHQLERRDGRSTRIVQSPTPSSQEARLSYRLLDTSKSRSFVEIDLESGRHHQIRVQMAHMGFPVVGDLRYGASTPLLQKQIALVATELEVMHPTLKAELRLSSPLPKGWPWPTGADEGEAPPWNWEELRQLFSFSP